MPQSLVVTVSNIANKLEAEVIAKYRRIDLTPLAHIR